MADDNETKIKQDGDGNEATVDQTSKDTARNASTITQRDSILGNTASVTQDGSGTQFNDSTLTQKGDNNGRHRAQSGVSLENTSAITADR